MRLAVHAPKLGLSVPDQPFGKDIANRGLYSALSVHGGFEEITFCTADNLSSHLVQQHFGSPSVSARLKVAPLSPSSPALEAGTLLRGQPYLSQLAWERGHRFTTNHRFGWPYSHFGSS